MEISNYVTSKSLEQTLIVCILIYLFHFFKDILNFFIDLILILIYFFWVLIYFLLSLNYRILSCRDIFWNISFLLIDFLSADRTFFASILNQLNRTKLMKIMATWKFTSWYHLFLTYSALVKLFNLLYLKILIVWSNAQNIVTIGDFKFNKRIIFFQAVNKLFELVIFWNFLHKFKKGF